MSKKLAKVVCYSREEGWYEDINDTPRVCRDNGCISFSLDYSLSTQERKLHWGGPNLHKQVSWKDEETLTGGRV